MYNMKCALMKIATIAAGSGCVAAGGGCVTACGVRAVNKGEKQVMWPAVPSPTHKCPLLRATRNLQLPSAASTRNLALQHLAKITMGDSLAK